MVKLTQMITAGSVNHELKKINHWVRGTNYVSVIPKAISCS